MALFSDDLGKIVCEALGIGVAEVSRIIIDICAGSPLMVYVQMLGSSKLLDINWSDVDKSEITIVE